MWLTPLVILAIVYLVDKALRRGGYVKADFKSFPPSFSFEAKEKEGRPKG